MNWNYEGVVLPISEAKGSDIEKGCIMERPKVIYNKQTGKFVMWFHLELKGRGYGPARAAVAVSDSPTGPYCFIRSARVNSSIYPLNMTKKEKRIKWNLSEYEKWWTPEWYDAVEKGMFVKRDLEGGQMSRDMTLFVDDDGKVYFYWGCSNETPMWGVELDPQTMNPKGEKKELIYADPYKYGYERIGDDNGKLPRSKEEVDACFDNFMKSQGTPVEQIPQMYIPMIRGMFTDKPYIEGAWMDKHDGRYYLQYAFAGTQYNTYGDGVYVSDKPLGPFTPAKNNPYSYHPGGFMPGAGHGSTMEDYKGNLWHAATMRISVNHDFERRVGIWKAAYDEEGELCCNQRYGDWPIGVSDGKEQDIWENPPWMLLSYKKEMSASSCTDGHAPQLAANENAQNWWQASSSDRKEWLMMDLGKAMDVHAIQINFADDEIHIPVPGQIRGTTQARYIEEADLVTRYLLEGSVDGEKFFVLEDKTKADTDLSHDFLVYENGMEVRSRRESGSTTNTF